MSHAELAQANTQNSSFLPEARLENFDAVEANSADSPAVLALANSENIQTRVLEQEFPEASENLETLGNSFTGDVIAQASPALPNSNAAPMGQPVPWAASQLPGAPPQAIAAPPGAGNWVMVWVPYGTPAAGPTAMPPQAYYPAWMPATMPNQPVGVPTFNTGAYGSVNPALAVPPAGGSPWSPAALPNGYGYPYGSPSPTGAFPPAPGLPQPYAVQPQPYAVQPQPYAAQPQPYSTPYYPVQGYPNYAVPAAPFEQPLAVPIAPSGSGDLPLLPSPPPVELPTYPANFYPGTSTVPSTLPPAISTPTPLTQVPSGLPTPALERVSEPITEPNLDAQGLYVLQGEESSARARLSGSTFLTPSVLVGGVLDVVTGSDLTDDDGVQLTELYVAAALPQVPSLRLRFGQLDLTSYFDRNSFAKDISRDFFNPTFQTNPALFAGANVTASRPGGLVQWAVTDDIALSAAVFSSNSDITDFALDGFAGEVSFRTGDLIMRGTFISSRDTQFQNTGDRLEAYGVNAEWFIPYLNLGLFGRYGRIDNASANFDADTYSVGFNLLDVFMQDDRLGVGYGRNLDLNGDDGETPDVLEVFYDFELIPDIRLGFTFQQRDALSESFAGFRIKGDLDLTPSLSLD
ncbi:MAG: hypothetical protein F6K04_04470 [Leptolyngbya sp. SIO4C5]|nr:hypothetical protein [Leptolyngbya sp. SIO4C5]